MPNLPSKQPSTPLSIRVANEVLEQLEALADATGRSKSFLAAEAIDRYLETESWQVQAIKETIKKAHSADATFVDHSKVSDWLNNWGTDEEQDPPK